MPLAYSKKVFFFFHTVLTKLISHQIEEQNKHFRSILSCFFSLCLRSLSFYPKWSFLSIKIQQIDDAIEKCKSLFLESPTLNMFPTRRSYFNELVSVTIWLEILGCYWWWNLFAMTVFSFFRFFSLYRIDKQRKTFLQKNMYVIYITLNKKEYLYWSRKTNTLNANSVYSMRWTLWMKCFSNNWPTALLVMTKCTQFTHTHTQPASQPASQTKRANKMKQKSNCSQRRWIAHS